jgi:hypothetical protein
MKKLLHQSLRIQLVFYLFLGMFPINMSQSIAQTNIWTEDFTYSDNVITGTAVGVEAGDWNIAGTFSNTASQYIKVVSNKLKFMYNDVKDIYFISDPIDVTGYRNPRITFTVGSSGTVDPTDYFYIDIFMDGVYSNTGSLNNDNTGTFYIDAATGGSTLEFLIYTDFNASGEYYTVDDLIVSGTAAASASNWIGGTSTDWLNPVNWDNGVPYIITDATIPTGTTYSPVIYSNTSAYCNNLTIDVSASLDYNATIAGGGALKIYGNFSNNGTFTDGGQIFTYMKGSGKTIGGSGTFVYAAIRCDDGSSISLANSITLWEIYISNVSVLGTLSLGAFTLNVESWLTQIGTINLDSGTLQYGGNENPPTLTNATFIEGTAGTMEYNRTGDQTIVGVVTYNDLVISGSGIKTLNATNTTSRDVLVVGGTLALSTRTLNIGRDFTNDGVLTATSGKANFNGNVAQTIAGTGTTTFHDLSIANTSGDVALSSNATVTGTLSMTSGDLVIATDKKLSITDVDDPGISGGSASSMIVTTDNATVEKTYTSTTTITFPLGNGSLYRPIALTPASSGNTIWTMSYTPEYHSDHDIDPASEMTNISHVEYWTANRSGSSPANAIVELTWHSGSAVEDYTVLTLAHYDGSTDWDKINSNPVGSNSSGTLTSTGSESSFGPFTIGSLSTINALPVSLISFYGKKNGANSDLCWSTASESNNAFYTVEKTTDGELFEPIGTVVGAGNSFETLSYSLTDYSVRPIINYYRLKQTDFDGVSTYSDPISVDHSKIPLAIISITNILGQEVKREEQGLIFIHFQNGTSIKVVQ